MESEVKKDIREMENKVLSLKEKLNREPKHEFCILKHILRTHANLLEFIEDIDDLELRSELAKLANELFVLAVDYANYKGNTARALYIIENLVEAEYHCVEKAGISDCEYNLLLAKQIRNFRQNFLKIVMQNGDANK